MLNCQTTFHLRLELISASLVCKHPRLSPLRYISFVSYMYTPIRRIQRSVSRRFRLCVGEHRPPLAMLAMTSPFHCFEYGVVPRSYPSFFSDYGMPFLFCCSHTGVVSSTLPAAARSKLPMKEHRSSVFGSLMGSEFGLAPPFNNIIFDPVFLDHSICLLFLQVLVDPHSRSSQS